MFSSESICDVDKNDYIHYENPVQWHCTILMKTARLKEDIDRAVREVCDIQPECIKMRFEFDFLLW